MATTSHSERPGLTLLPQAPAGQPVDDAEADRLYAEALAAARRAGRVAAELERVAGRAPDPAWSEAAAACRRAQGALQRAGEVVPSVALDPAGGAERGVIALGPLVIDRGPRRAQYEGRPLTLTRREFDLLCALARQAGSVVTKADLMREVWSFQGSASRTRTLDSHASRVRRALVVAGASAEDGGERMGRRLSPGRRRPPRARARSVNGPEHGGTCLGPAVRRALEGDDLEPCVRALLELRFPPKGARGASLDEAAAALRWSPAMAAHVEFATLCAIAAAESSRAVAPEPRRGATGWRARPSRRSA